MEIFLKYHSIYYSITMEYSLHYRIRTIITTDIKFHSFPYCRKWLPLNLILNLGIELYRGYINTGFTCHDLSNKSHNYSNFIYCGAHYFITDWDEVFLVNLNLLSCVISAQSIVMAVSSLFHLFLNCPHININKSILFCLIN